MSIYELTDELTDDFKNMSNTLEITLEENATMPTRATEGSAGYDLYSCNNYEIKSRSQILVDTGVKMKIPQGYYARIAPRSGLSWKKFTDVGAGVIDSDYRGIIKVILRNFSDDTLSIFKGDKIAQIIITKISTPKLIVVEILDDTERGEGGFGSTGIN